MEQLALKNTLSILAGAIFLSSCSTVSPTNTGTSSEQKVQTKTNKIDELAGISGLTAQSPLSFVAVHDAKVYEPEKPRITVINISSDGESISYNNIPFPENASNLSNDLEGICKVPGKPDEFLLSESGYWEKEYGKIFHISITGSVANLIREIQLPLIRDNNENQYDGDQFEGLVCSELSNDKILVILGERGATDVYPNGVLRWGQYNLTQGSISWDNKSIDVTAPDRVSDSKVRSITDLYLDSKNSLWAASAIDGSDIGPFTSSVYRIGFLDTSKAIPVSINISPNSWVINGMKVEGLASGVTPDSFSIGTEDEALGGVWRPLPSK